MSNAKDFAMLYREVEDNISKALTDISAIKLTNKKGNEQLSVITAKLDVMKSQFNSEINFLEKHSEWEKFTIAFFGETNAGKSTIIESLRVIFKEKTRHELIQQNRESLKKVESDFSNDADQLIQDLNSMYEQFSRDVTDTSKAISSLAEINKQEIAAYKQELASLAEINKQEIAAYKQELASLTELNKQEVAAIVRTNNKKLEKLAVIHNQKVATLEAINNKAFSRIKKMTVGFVIVFFIACYFVLMHFGYGLNSNFAATFTKK
jgi:hypothetical protein